MRFLSWFLVVVPLEVGPLAALEPATCCLEDVSAPSSPVCRVLFPQVTSGGGSIQSPGVRSGYARWNDRENDCETAQRFG